ncbi:MAG TPA: EAL domain-containing protein, partial [Rhizobiales bacterium]|nr:EAL domain-containing protein [Hyphomicrobiales bacterium]
RIICSNLSHTAMKKLALDRSLLTSTPGLSLSLSRSYMPGQKVLVVRSRLKPNLSAFAVISPIAIFGGFQDKSLLHFVQLQLELADHQTINRIGSLAYNFHDGSEVNGIQAVARSKPLPLVAHAALSAEYINWQTQDQRSYATAAGLVGGTLIGFLIIWVSQRERSMTTKINIALRRREFIPKYQPIICARTGVVLGCEVLVRWQRRNGEMVPPNMFIPFTETSGQIVPLTRQLMEMVRDEMGDFCRDHPGFFFSINLVAGHFENNDIIRDVERIFSGSGIQPNNLIFEITERHPLHDINAARAIIEGLQSMGARVALDDAGTGHGGLAYIQSLGFDEVKIDKMFIDGIGREGLISPVADGLIMMCRQLGMAIIAEGVETQEQLTYLRNHNVDMVQGFLFSPAEGRDVFIQYYNAYMNALNRSPEIHRPAMKLLASA